MHAELGKWWMVGGRVGDLKQPYVRGRWPIEISCSHA